MDTTLTGANTPVNTSDKMNCALQVALQTMKERCVELQRRLSSKDEEIQRLREGDGSDSAETGNGDLAEVQVLRLRLQLQRQNDQMNMVSNENRRLWSMLSQISKEQQSQTPPNTSKVDDEEATPTNQRNGSCTASSSANQNLIRSKTFTQHSPNPRLRQKMISDGMRDISLEEIALDDFGAGEAFAATGDADLGYVYGLQVDDVSSASEPDAKRCMDNLQDLRREAMKQQQQLMKALPLLEARIAPQPCSVCAQKAASKPEMADKSLETDESLNNELKRYHSDQSSSQVHETTNDRNGHGTSPTPSRLNIITEKLKADDKDKICPMCGQMFSNQVSFKAFQEHVELHFTDDVHVESSIDHNFEMVSHAVGDF